MNTRGQASVTWRARPGAVGRSILAHGFILAAVPCPPFAVALIEGAQPLAIALGIPLLLCILAGIWGRFARHPDDLRAIEAVCTLSALLMIACAIPLAAFMSMGMTFTDAVFEAVSGVTSTGLSMTGGSLDWPLSAHVLRAWLQWTGGFAIAVAGAALILGPGKAARAMGNAGLTESDILTSTRQQARSMLIAYAAITVVGVAVLIPLMPAPWEALVVALAAVSTGGFSPRPDSLASYSGLAQGVTIALCISTSFSLMAYVYLRRRGLRDAITRTNVTAMLSAMAAGTVVSVFALWQRGLTADEIGAGVVNFLSGFSTAGFSAAPVSAAPVILALLMAAMMIGGGTGSTAGGLKIDRLVLAYRMLRLTLLRMRSPDRAVTRLMDHGRQVEIDRITAVAAVALCYSISLVVGWMIFLMAGLDPLGSLFDMVSALSTVGLSSGVTDADLAPHLKYVLVVAMLLGRLEFLALIAAVSPITWFGR